MDIKKKAIKRLKIQSWRRGMKEMDLIFGQFADENLDLLNIDEIASFERLLLQDDQVIFSWFSDLQQVPKEFSNIIKKICVCIGLK